MLNCIIFAVSDDYVKRAAEEVFKLVKIGKSASKNALATVERGMRTVACPILTGQEACQ